MSAYPIDAVAFNTLGDTMTHFSRYSIASESDSRIIAVIVSGFWTLETVKAFASDLGRAVRKLGTNDQHMLILGFDDADVAPGPVIDALRHLAAASPMRPAKMALYADSALKRLQLGRIADAGGNARVFDTREDAMEWVRSP